jgi:hypothetical protein
MKRSSRIQYRGEIDLKQTPLKIWGYDSNDNFVCRLEINSAGLAIYTGPTGTQPLADLSWRKLVSSLARRSSKNSA